MALGYCTYCDTLRTIKPGPQKWGSRECEWSPVAHWINVHDCGAIVIIEGTETDAYPEAIVCVSCGPLDPNKLEFKSIRCPGEGKVIK